LTRTSPFKFETTHPSRLQRNNLKVAIKSNPLTHGNRVQILPGDTNTSVRFNSVWLIPAAATGLKTAVPHSLHNNSLPTLLFCVQTFSCFLLFVSPLFPSTPVSLLSSAHVPTPTCTPYQQFILLLQTLSHLLAELKFPHLLCEFKQGNN
jgi:hypothetical protein